MLQVNNFLTSTVKSCVCDTAAYIANWLILLHSKPYLFYVMVHKEHDSFHSTKWECILVFIWSLVEKNIFSLYDVVRTKISKILSIKEDFKY